MNAKMMNECLRLSILTKKVKNSSEIACHMALCTLFKCHHTKRLILTFSSLSRSPSEHSGRKGCCGQFFHSPKSLGLIAMIALGGVACALGGAAWGASGLAGQPSTHLTMSLLMIGKQIFVP